MHPARRRRSRRRSRACGGPPARAVRALLPLSDAEDALQETLLAAWRGLAGFEQRSSLRAWLYRIATNCCIRLASRRPRRILSWDHGPSWDPADGDLGTPVEERIFLDPLPHTGMDRDAPASSYGRREHVALAYVAALQHLTANQRAVLIRAMCCLSPPPRPPTCSTRPYRRSPVRCSGHAAPSRTVRRTPASGSTRSRSESAAPSTAGSPPGSARTYCRSSNCSPRTSASRCRLCLPGSTAVATLSGSLATGCSRHRGVCCR